MPKGLKAKSNKSKKGKSLSKTPFSKEMILKSDMEDYAKITKLHGDCKVIVMLPNSSTIMARIPGKFHKKKEWWMAIGDIVLISHRDFQDNMVDIVTKYQPGEVRTLYKDGEIPKFFIDGGEDQEKDTGIIMDEKIETDLNII